LAAVQSNEVYPTPVAAVRSACFGGASDKRFPLCKSCHNGQEPSLATGGFTASPVPATSWWWSRHEAD
jgi:hypothetical protein